MGQPSYVFVVTFSLIFHLHLVKHKEIMTMKEHICHIQNPAGLQKF
jgi:hypothetical protein